MRVNEAYSENLLSRKPTTKETGSTKNNATIMDECRKSLLQVVVEVNESCNFLHSSDLESNSHRTITTENTIPLAGVLMYASIEGILVVSS